jgi:hypothetical protein
MPGGGLMAALITLVLVPVELWIAARASWRSLPEIEKNLRLASHPPALAAVAAFAAVRFHVHGLGDELAALIARPIDNELVLSIGGGLLLFVAVLWLVGVSLSLGVRDPKRAVLAFLRLAIGGAAVAYLWPGTFPVTATWAALGAWFFGVWCLVTGTMRAVLLTVGHGNAFAFMARRGKFLNAQLLPARRWRFGFPLYSVALALAGGAWFFCR